MKPRLRDLTRAVRRPLAALALVAQAVLLAAPLVDVHPASEPEAPLLAVAGHGSLLLTPPGDQGSQHDASRCPACIAQSIHAPPPAAPCTFWRDLECRHVGDAVAAISVSLPVPGQHHSRAPPAIA